MMIDVARRGADTFEVTVREANSSTRHRVTMSESDYKRLSGERVSEELCLEAAFRFLLDREPKEQILKQFNVTVIARYFPEFAREFPKYLSG
jgi:hypothetical protein